MLKRFQRFLAITAIVCGLGMLVPQGIDFTVTAQEYTCTVVGTGRTFVVNNDKRYVVQCSANAPLTVGSTVTLNNESVVVYQQFRDFTAGTKRFHLRTASSVSWSVGTVLTATGGGGGGGALATLPLLQSTTSGSPSITWTGKVYFKNDEWSTNIDGGCSSLSYGGEGLGLSTDGTKMFIGSHQQDGKCWGYYNIPALNGVGTRAFASHAGPSPAQMAVFKPQDETTSLRHGGAMMWSSNRVFFTIFGFYDNSPLLPYSHFYADPATLSTWQGPFRIVDGSGTPINTRVTAGYMVKLDATWATAFGKEALTGNGSQGIISTTSFGPALTVWNPSEVNGTADVTGIEVLGYPQTHATLLDGFDYSQYGGRYYETTKLGSCFPVKNTRTILCVGSRGTSYHATPDVNPNVNHICYGSSTTNPALAGTTDPQGNDVCYDLVDTGKGPHAYPYTYFVYAYDALDLIAVRNGTSQKWQAEPYALWNIDWTAGASDAGVVAGGAVITYGGAAYDPNTNRLYIVSEIARDTGTFDGTGYPIRVEVFTVSTP